jgi:hypothetical protein
VCCPLCGAGAGAGVVGVTRPVAHEPPCEQVLAEVGAGARVRHLLSPLLPGIIHTHKPPYKQLLVGVVAGAVSSVRPPRPLSLSANSTPNPPCEQSLAAVEWVLVVFVVWCCRCQDFVVVDVAVSTRDPTCEQLLTAGGQVPSLPLPCRGGVAVSTHYPPCKQSLAAVGVGACWLRVVNGLWGWWVVSDDVACLWGLGVRTLGVPRCTGLPAPPWAFSSLKRAPHIPFEWGGGGGHASCVVVVDKHQIS